MVWGSVLLPPRRATAHEAATDVGTTIVVEGHITDIGPRAQHTNAKISEEEFQRLLSDLKVHDAEMHRATILLGRLGDKRAIEPMLEKLRSGHVVEEANQALEQLGAGKEAIFQANVLAAKKLRKAAVAYLGELGDKRAIAYVIEVFNKEGAFFTEPCDINDLTWYLH